MKATAAEKPIWIMVSVIGSGKLKYFGERTHYKHEKGKRSIKAMLWIAVNFLIIPVIQDQSKSKAITDHANGMLRFP